ncbi:MAG TPA: TIGR03960 family B12-binding radical SAM protein [Pseudoflavonifractor sp.]|nr:TIGR03960 family B12-binding radical SAM protein [Pseudoflavonifractor sp.]
MDRSLERILPRVQKPARYTGGEYNAVVKDPREVEVRYALCFPDTYEIGMSNLGLRILYGVMNDLPWVWCERAFAPWGDMEEELRREGIFLYGLESGDPIADFDLIGFSLGYEMAYTNVLNMLDLAGLPVRAEERRSLSPIVVAGGTCAFNIEPLAPFVDLVSLGEGEEVSVELLELYRRAKAEEWGKGEFLAAAAHIPGIYVPSLYDVTYKEDGTVAAITPRGGAPEVVTKRIVQDFERSYFPAKTIVPSTEIVHDRVTLEVFRGCIRGCRFCQAGYAYRPVRSRSPELLARYGEEACRASGYQEMTLSSLSTSDYRHLNELCDGLMDFCEPNGVNLSLPSLRADNFSMDLMRRMQRGKKSGLTFAPEAGTQRLRDAINKNVTEEEILGSCAVAFSGGWSAVKLYFMLGLPTETDEDVLGIADLAEKIYRTWRENTQDLKRGVRITVSTAFFVPKPHTAFQWEGQITMEEYRRRVKLLREHMKGRSIVYNWHEDDTSYLEAVFARGDRRLSDVIEAAWRKGAKFDSWSEYFDFGRWMDTFRECGVDPDFYAARVRERGEVLPWSTVSTGVRTDFLWREREACYRAAITPDCRRQCTACGADKLLCPGGKCDAQ